MYNIHNWQFEIQNVVVIKHSALHHFKVAEAFHILSFAGRPSQDCVWDALNHILIGNRLKGVEQEDKCHVDMDVGIKVVSWIYNELSFWLQKGNCFLKKVN